MMTQKQVTCFLVTDAGKLLPEAQGNSWTKCIITVIILTHRGRYMVQFIHHIHQLSPQFIHA